MMLKFKTSLRWKIAIISIIIFCVACFIGLIIVFGSFFLFYNGKITHMVMATTMLISYGFAMVIGSIALWYISKFVAEPVLKISDGAKKVAQGDFGVEIVHKGQDEIGELAVNFNKMVRELQGMDYMKKNFISNVSHEVKTPIAAITGFTEMLIDGGLEKEEENDYLLCIYNESIRLSRLCDNMMKVSQLDHQAILLNRRVFYVDEQIRKCIILLDEKWNEKNIDYELDLQKCKVSSDYDLLYQLWVNLIDNAIKFSEPGGKIYISAINDFNSNKIFVKIKDQGIGITEEKLHKIFEKFYQCEESHKEQGAGLGLSIAKRIVELVDGEIICNSKKNEGCEFIISI
jgi:signal transduction histidine kinase